MLTLRKNSKPSLKTNYAPLTRGFVGFFKHIPTNNAYLILSEA